MANNNRFTQTVKEKMKAVSLTLILLSTIVVFQNCGENSLPADATIATTTASTSASSSSTLAATYAPNPATLSSAVTLTATGGTSPYTYTLVAGAGKLVSNVYAAPAAAETALISVADSKGSVIAVTILVGAATSTTTGTTATPTPSPTPATTSIAGTALPNGTFYPRSCNLATLLAAGQAAGSNLSAAVAPAINYETCLVLSRAPTSTELSNYSSQINNCQIGPLDIMIKEFSSSEAQTNYGYTSMTAANFVTFMFRLNLVRDPTSSESSTYVNMLNNGYSQTSVYQYFLESSSFMSGQPYIATIVNEWDNFYDNECD